MSSEAQLKKMIEQRCESRNLDYKERLNWDRATNDEKCAVVKDILAFFNTQNGGVMIFGVQDKSLELVGLTDNEFASFDTTKVNDFLQRYTDPSSACEVQKFKVGDQRVVVIGVAEFKDVPVVCKRDANSSRDPSKVILKAGGLYIRTDKATSVIVPSAEEMRDLVNRALLKRGDQLVNTIEALVQRSDAVYEENIEELVAARTKHLRQSIENIERSYDITIEALGSALDLKTSDMGGHSKRVTAYTIGLARAMGSSVDEIRMIARGAFLHDIGKLAIPDSILLKPGVLNEDEFRRVQEHCHRGYQIVRRIPFLADSAEIVYAHHEKFDGSGYPRGLKGEEIPVGARFIALANTLDVMTSDQPYRSRKPLTAAIEEIEGCSGRQFDPTIVKVFLSMPKNIWSDLRGDIESDRYLEN